MTGGAVSVKPPRLMAVGSQPVAPWQPPSMDASLAEPATLEVAEEQVRVVEEDAAPPPELPTAEEIEAIQREAWEEGYRAGHAEGRAAGQAEIDALVARWQGLVNALAQPLDAADGDLESALLELALALTRQLVRRELKTQPDEIIPVVREALGVLPSAAQDIVVRLHPEDAALVTSTLHSPGSAWRVEEDGAIGRGGCVVTSSTSRVDATLERRIAQLMAGVLGDAREEVGE
ncbi:MAG: flagellar assembly protein FliH [Pseudomonadota bacterium]